MNVQQSVIKRRALATSRQPTHVSAAAVANLVVAQPSPCLLQRLLDTLPFEKCRSPSQSRHTKLCSAIHSQSPSQLSASRSLPPLLLHGSDDRRPLPHRPDSTAVNSYTPAYFGQILSVFPYSCPSFQTQFRVRINRHDGEPRSRSDSFRCRHGTHLQAVQGSFPSPSTSCLRAVRTARAAQLTLWCCSNTKLILTSPRPLLPTDGLAPPLCS
jgi:hypothetical protein